MEFPGLSNGQGELDGWRIIVIDDFVDLLAKRVLFATPCKDVPVWEAFAAQLLRHNGLPKYIKYVAIDMSAAYIKGVSHNFGNAQVVYNTFHVIQNVVEACD